MRKTILKTAVIALCAVLLLGALSACGAAKLTGTWYSEDSGEIFFNFDEDGSVAGYDGDSDTVIFGTWTKDGKTYEISGLSDEILEFKMKDKNTLYNEEYEVALVRGEDREIPAITVDELAYDTWITEDGIYELEFYYGGDWDLYDDDEGEYILEGTYTLANGKLIMKAEDGTTYKPAIADNRVELTLDDVVFFLED